MRDASEKLNCQGKKNKALLNELIKDSAAQPILI
jgi:hypothetical protein